MEQTAYISRMGKVRPPEPMYGRGEDLFNAVSHIVGGALGVAFCIALCIVASYNPTVNKFVSAGVYSFSIVVLYTMSALYHFFPQGRAKRVFRIFDHCTIFLLIAGCYTPFCLLTFWGSAWGYAILAVEWGLAVLGITFNAINMRWKAVKVLSMIAYVVMGWMIIFSYNSISTLLAKTGLILLITGGISYTIGAIFCGLGTKKKYFHSIFHFFVLLGSTLQFFSILLYTI